ncbi:hypothetical protein QQF64_033734 [Cirrhinus molitorella]|uniref:Uncharacterized protein n=1 Tax=Cirrhinus molitorella TaxID=172907 RepID=A0ABR3MUT6_9TELE
MIHNSVSCEELSDAARKKAQRSGELKRQRAVLHTHYEGLKDTTCSTLRLFGDLCFILLKRAQLPWNDYPRGLGRKSVNLYEARPDELITISLALTHRLRAT